VDYLESKIINTLIFEEMSEHKLQAECFQWHWNKYITERGMLYHNNNNSVNAIAGNKMKALGVVKGVTDFTLIIHKGVVFIEMKTETGVLKPEQVDFQRKVVERGHFYHICRSLEDFQNFIIGIYGW
jgi:hypothetical protein